MSIYLHDIPLLEAQARFQQALEEAGLWRVLGVESIPLDENALGRVLAEPVWAKISSPHYHASAMDGFAVKAEGTIGAQPSSPITISISRSTDPRSTDPQSTDPRSTDPRSTDPRSIYVDTGDPLPDWANAVIPIENVESLDAQGRITHDLRSPSSIRIRASVAPWSHVRPLGEDIVATQLVLPAGQILRPVDLGAAAAAGHTAVRVARKPKVAILPTGTELVSIGAELKRGDILEYNSLVMASQIKAMGGDPTRFPITEDNFDLICERVKQAALTHDLILLNAGSSAGAEDFSAKVVETLGTLLVHGVAVRPGHPVILGIVESSKLQVEGLNIQPSTLKPATPIIGVPGYPVSAALTVEIFVEALIAKWLGRAPAEAVTVEATLTRKITSPGGDDDYVRVAVGRVGEKMLAAPLSRGAGVITSLVRADGLVILPRGVQGAEAGERVTVRLYRHPADLERTIFAIGSHDMTLDLMAQFLSERGRRLASANVGSQGGLIALNRGEAHLAGSHLLDPATGEYNLSAIKQYLPGVPVKVIALVRREQGLIVRKGNLKKIKTLIDLARADVAYVNRQRGAGTRVLLDYQLGLAGVSAESIRGYGMEEYTHLGVAAAIASGRADCGLGIPAAALALDLDFVPLFSERYDLIIPKTYAQGELLAPLLELIQMQSFRNAVKNLPGYDVGVMGTLIAEV
jgi:putative molybdopterin biosynthesis protein